MVIRVGVRRRPRGPGPRPRPGRRLHRPRRARVAVPGRRRRSPYAVAAAGRGAHLPARRDARPGRPGLRYHSRRGRRRVLHLPGADRRRALRHRRRRGRARRPARRLGRRAHARRAPGAAARSCSPSTSRPRRPGSRTPTLVDDRSVLQRPDHPRRTPSGRHAAQRRAGARDGRRGGAQRPADQPGLEQRDQVGVVLPGGDHRARRARSTPRWMQRTFDNFWRGWAQWATEWTNSWLQPAAAAPARGRRRRRPAPGGRRADRRRLRRRRGCSRPGGSTPPRPPPSWRASGPSRQSRFDPRDLRRALGQYATGVTVVTTIDADGRAVRDDRELVHLGLAQPAAGAVGRREVLPVAARVRGRRRGSRSTCWPPTSTTCRGSSPPPAPTSSTASGWSPGDLPLLEGTVAHFVCRRLPGDRGRLDAGDHVLFLGEIESYDAPGGEPLVFHSGFYRLATKHPDL